MYGNSQKEKWCQLHPIFIVGVIETIKLIKITEEVKKVWKVIKTDFGWSNKPKDIYLECFEDIIKAAKQALPYVSNCNAIFEKASKFPDEDIECDAIEADIY